jgi:hypothetical protein
MGMMVRAPTVVAVALSEGGERMVLGVYERALVVCDAHTNTEVRRVELSHRIRAVFTAAGPDEPCSRAYVVVDGPEPVLEVDYTCGMAHAVMDGETQQPFLARGTSDVRLDYMHASADGRHVAVAFTDGSVALYSLGTTVTGKPLFAPLDMWAAGDDARAVSMVFAGKSDTGDEDEAAAPPPPPAYIVALMMRKTVPRGKCATYLARFSIGSNDFLRTFQADVGEATSISAVPDRPNLVALFVAGAAPAVCYIDVRHVAMHCVLVLRDRIGNAATSSLVALQGGEYGEYAVVVAGGGRAVLMTCDEDTAHVRETSCFGARPADADDRTWAHKTSTCWRTMPAGGSTAALARVAGPPMFINAENLVRSG